MSVETALRDVPSDQAELVELIAQGDATARRLREVADALYEELSVNSRLSQLAEATAKDSERIDREVWTIANRAFGFEELSDVEHEQHPVWRAIVTRSDELVASAAALPSDDD